MFSDVPYEMRLYPNWIVWRFERIEGRAKPTKVPYRISDWKKASVTEPADWASFDGVVKCVTQWPEQLHGIGFVFGGNGAPFTGIDLDGCFNPDGTLTDRAQLIVETFDSYTEISPSQQGLHIICKGRVPSGKRRENVEIYSDGRYFTVSGRVYRPGGLMPRQYHLEKLWQELGGQTHRVDIREQFNEPATEEDLSIYNRACQAENGDKFRELYQGNWQQFYESQSEADFALLNIVAFYTRNYEQIERLFFASALGKRDKAKRQDYRDYMLRRVHDNQPPPMSLVDVQHTVTAISEQLRVEYAVPDPVPVHVPAAMLENDPYQVPPGLVGSVAQYIYNQSMYPIREASIAAALILMAGICGRQYQTPTDTGLNLYIMVLAKTGAGKEAMAEGTSRLLTAVAGAGEGQTGPDGINLGFPAVKAFRGPAEVSGKGVLNTFLKTDSPLSFFCIMQEFAIKMAQLADPRNTNAGDQALKKLLLDLYMKSGAGSDYAGTTLADKEKNVPIISSPAFSVLCESTPENLYQSLDERLVKDGLLPRFTIFEVTDVNGFNRNRQIEPPDYLVDEVKALALNVLNMKRTGDMRVTVACTDDAHIMHDSFREYCRERTLDAENGVIAELWNRAHLKALRMASLVAVGCNRFAPTITVEHFSWAKAIVVHEVSMLMARFERGDIGEQRNYDKEQLEYAMRQAKRYFATEHGKLPNTYKKFGTLQRNGIIPRSYLQMQCACAAPFRKSINGRAAFEWVMKELVAQGMLANLQPDTKRQLCPDMQAYTIGRWLLTS